VYPIPSLWLVARDYFLNAIHFPINDRRTKSFVSLKEQQHYKVKSSRAKKKKKPFPKDVV
jgi:hypothetical protein